MRNANSSFTNFKMTESFRNIIMYMTVVSIAALLNKRTLSLKYKQDELLQITQETKLHKNK